MGRDGLKQFWGKAHPGSKSVHAWHPLVWHSLDVAAVLERLLELPEFGEAVPAPWHRVLVLLSALHDVGKATRPFQAIVPELWPPCLGPYDRREAPRHDTLGWLILRDALTDQIMPCFAGRNMRAAEPLLRAVTGHHGRPPEEAGPWRPSPNIFCSVCNQAATELAHIAHEIIVPEQAAPVEFKECAHLSWLIAGLVNLADWIGSSQAHFPYTAPEACTPVEYWQHARKQARVAVERSGLRHTPVAPAFGMGGLFPSDIAENASPMQRWAENVPLPNGPVLVLIEDVTGSGKTEASLVLAHRLMMDRRAQGLFFALPTMATADAMFERLSASYRRMFAPGTTPLLVLSHSHATVHPGFRAGILDDAAEPGGAGEDGAEPAGAACAAWIADDRRKAFLAEVGAGTVDQALLAALPSRFAALRLLGLSRRVLIVDEAHAYDPYVQAELGGLLRFQAVLGGSAIILSATLPQAMRRVLIGAFAPGQEEAAVRDDYPLATIVAARNELSPVSEHPIEARKESIRHTPVRRIAAEADAVEAIHAAEGAGAAVVWIRNTVDDAMNAADAVRARGVKPILFHARFAMCDRREVEGEVLRRFGKHGTDRRGVVIATQVVEQSLDLDFDLMVTDLAPIDLMIQRAGRLWRHKRGARPLCAPELLVLSPEPVADPPEDWLRKLLPGTQAVYRDPAMLWRSARVLFAAGEIATPTGMRALIESVYASGADVPARLEPASDKARGRAISAGKLGEFNVLKPEDGYCRTGDRWEDDVQTPTRLTEDTCIVRLARVATGAVVPWANADTSARAWMLSEVSVRRSRLGAPAMDASLTTAVERAKQEWPKFLREMPVLVLSGDGAGWTEVSGYPDSIPRYHPRIGLTFSNSSRHRG